MNYPVALGTKATKLLFTPNETLPITIVIDSEGNVRDVIEGVVFPEEFEHKIKPLLSEITGHRSGRDDNTRLLSIKIPG